MIVMRRHAFVGTFGGLIAGVMLIATGACSSTNGDDHRDKPVAAATGHPISNCAAVDHTTATPGPLPTPPPPAPPKITGFDDFTAVRPCDYPGPTHYGWSSTRFKTTDSVHCDLYDPDSFQYYSEIICWGELPGAPSGMNAVAVTPGAAAAFTHVDVATMETHHLGTGGDLPVDPGSYRELARGQKLLIPGVGRGAAVDQNDEICAVDRDGALTCEIQNPQPNWGDGKTHGFHLSDAGSRVY